MTDGPRFTIVAPMLNEAGNVEPMAREIAEACEPHAPFEAIFVNDGSTDDTARRIASLREEFPWLREVRHHRPCGQSAAIHLKTPVDVGQDGMNLQLRIIETQADVLQTNFTIKRHIA